MKLKKIAKRMSTLSLLYRKQEKMLNKLVSDEDVSKSRVGMRKIKRMSSNTSGSSAEAERVRGFRSWWAFWCALMAISSRSWEIGGVYIIKPKTAWGLKSLVHAPDENRWWGNQENIFLPDSSNVRIHTTQHPPWPAHCLLSLLSSLPGQESVLFQLDFLHLLLNPAKQFFIQQPGKHVFRLWTPP